jgi:CRP-like cAMP-binding protein
MMFYFPLFASQTETLFSFFLIIGDIIIKEGTIGSKMYFIQEGIVDIVMANGEVRIPFFSILDYHHIL